VLSTVVSVLGEQLGSLIPVFTTDTTVVIDYGMSLRRRSALGTQRSVRPFWWILYTRGDLTMTKS